MTKQNPIHTIATRRVGLLVGGASTLLLISGITVLIAVLYRSGEPSSELRNPSDRDRVLVDVDDILPWVIMLAGAGVIAVAIIAWLAARWAARPLYDALELQKRFVADASHELRTPLTSLNSRVQILQRRYEHGEEIADTIAKLRQDTAVLDDTLTDLLLAAEGQSNSSNVAAVSECALRAVSTVEPLANKARVTISNTVPDQVNAAIPPVTLTRLCVALLDNAIAHSPTDSGVTITAETRASTVYITVADQGPGVKAQDRERIFERFARSATATPRQGFGLGLALVKDAVMRHGGDITLAHTSPAGSSFVLSIPVSSGS